MMLLTKRDIVKKISPLRYPANEYWITAGAGLVMHGVKLETRDIDMGCSGRLADSLIQHGATWLYMEDGSRKIITDGDIELFENWSVDSVIEIEGLSVASLESVRKQKIALNRPKDWEDILLIDRHMEARST